MFDWLRLLCISKSLFTIKLPCLHLSYLALIAIYKPVEKLKYGLAYNSDNQNLPYITICPVYCVLIWLKSAIKVYCEFICMYRVIVIVIFYIQIPVSSIGIQMIGNFSQGWHISLHRFCDMFKLVKHWSTESCLVWRLLLCELCIIHLYQGYWIKILRGPVRKKISNQRSATSQ